MCGIVGAWSTTGHVGEHLQLAIERLSHRGPDARGHWIDEVCGIGLGHSRLSVLDLSSAGHQPMISACSRYVIVFNGEIYNHLALRVELGLHAPSWRGHSDTETLLACFSAWGVERTLKATKGMFALALWDRRLRKLLLARDRFGEKPLYFGYVGKTFVFASEIKGIAHWPHFSKEINRNALSLFLRYSYVPAPHSIYLQLQKLPPGTWLELSERDVLGLHTPKPRAYWSAFEVAASGVRHPLKFDSDEEAIRGLEQVVSQAVAEQMLADVPLGAFLSGGIDSSTVVALMQRHSRQPVKTFSIGFYENAYNEATFAKQVAQCLGTEHTELYVTPEDALAVIPKLPHVFDEPFSDSSQIPTILVSELARKHVTVALSGDGGDELFGGYNRYFVAARAWRFLETIPRSLRSTAGNIVFALPVEAWNFIYHFLSPIIPKKYRWQNPGDKLHKAALLLDSQNESSLYQDLISHWEPMGLVKGVTDHANPHPPALPHLRAAAERMMLLDTVSYLPDDILVKVDRAAMSVSLETRVPFLDHAVFEFAWRLPLIYKFRGGVGKWLLRQLLSRYLPINLVDRPKMGFGIPLSSWLRGTLREWAEELLDERRLREEGFLDPKPIRKKWAEHLSGRRNWQYQLWDVLMFQAWYERSCT